MRSRCGEYYLIERYLTRRDFFFSFLFFFWVEQKLESYYYYFFGKILLLLLLLFNINEVLLLKIRLYNNKNKSR
jgi:hypothetical protein